MSDIRRKISTVLLQVLDLLVDATYLFVWTILNWLVLRELNRFHPSIVIMLLLWSAQAVFAAFALAIILLHLYHDLTVTAEEDSGLLDVWQKLKDISNHLVSLTMLSILLIAWALMNTVLHLGLERFRSEASLVVDVSAWILEGLFAVRTLLFTYKKMSKELKIIYGRLFPKSVKLEGS